MEIALQSVPQGPCLRHCQVKIATRSHLTERKQKKIAQIGTHQEPFPIPLMGLKPHFSGFLRGYANPPAPASKCGYSTTLNLNFGLPPGVQFPVVPELQSAKGTVVDGRPEQPHDMSHHALAHAVDLVVFRKFRYPCRSAFGTQRILLENLTMPIPDVATQRTLNFGSGHDSFPRGSLTPLTRAGAYGAMLHFSKDCLDRSLNSRNC